jgi:hypothetical protein
VLEAEFEGKERREIGRSSSCFSSLISVCSYLIVSISSHILAKY